MAQKDLLDWYFFGFRQITFGRIDDPTSLCERKEYSYEDVVYDEIMQCQMGHEQKCFSTQETTFTSYNVSSFVSYRRKKKTIGRAIKK